MSYTTKSKILQDPAILEVSPELSQRAYLNILEDMQQEKAAMEDQRKATFNILNDVSEGQERLKKSYRELDIIKVLVQELEASLDIPHVFTKLIQAFRAVLPENVNYSYLIVPFDYGKPQEKINIYAQTFVGRRYCDAIRNHMRQNFHNTPGLEKEKEKLETWLQSDIACEVLGGGWDEQLDISPQTLFSVPLIVYNEVLGVVNVSDLEPHGLTQHDIELIKTLTGATATTIARLRQLLISERSRIEVLVQEMSNGVVMFDRDLRVTLSNPSAQKMTGLPSQGFYISELIKLFASATATAGDSLEKSIKEIFTTGSSLHLSEMTASQFTYEFSITPLRGLQGEIIGGAIIMHDITYLKEIDRAKSEFISIASHQLRTPLGSMRWNLELLEQEITSLSPAAQEQFREAYKSNLREIGLIGYLLQVARIEQGQVIDEPAFTDISDIIKDAIQEISPEANKKSIQIQTKIQKSLPKITIDPKRFREVIQNLLSNAVHYTLSHGRVIIEAGKSEDSIKIAVADTGICIPEKDQNKIFSKFFRSENATKLDSDGSGLGLFIVKSYVEKWGGKVWFESKEEEGTTFYIILPIHG